MNISLMKALSFFIQFQGDSFNHRLHIIGCKRILQELKQQGKFIFSLRFCDQFDLYISNVILHFLVSILFQVVKETLDSNVTSSGDTSSGEISAAASNSISKHRREVLIRQPSYCKILDDLQGTEEKVLKQATAKMKGQHNVLEVICIYYYYEDLRQLFDTVFLNDDCCYINL